MKLLTTKCCLIFIVMMMLGFGCSEDTTPIVILDEVESVTIIDYGNENNATDIFLQFSEIQDEKLLQYEFLVSTNSSLTIDEALELEASSKLVIDPGLGQIQFKIMDLFSTVEGSEIRNGTDYFGYILAKSSTEQQSSISQPVSFNLLNEPYYEMQSLVDISRVEALTLSPDGKFLYYPTGPVGPITSLDAFEIVEIATGEKTRIEGGLALPIGGCFDENGDFYLSIYNDGDIYKYDSDFNRTTFASGLSGPAGSTFSSNGDMLVANSANSTFYRITENGSVSTFSTSSLYNGPDGIIIVDGQIYALNYFDGQIYKISGSGFATEFATLPGTLTGYITYNGNDFFVPSISNHRIYKIDKEGNFEVVAGNGSQSSSDGPGPALLASLDNPNGIAASKTGDTLFVGNHGAIRMLIKHE